MQRTRYSTLVDLVPILGFSLIAIFVSFDLIGDSREGISAIHLCLEGLALIVSLAGAIGMYRLQGSVFRQDKLALQSKIRELNSEQRRWREQASNYLLGLGVAIDEQFSRWALTPAEKDIGLLLLKGMSHKEIASLRETTEQTVRQQSTAIYRKSGLQGRADLAAFFLEDLLLPSPIIANDQRKTS